MSHLSQGGDRPLRVARHRLALTTPDDGPPRFFDSGSSWAYFLREIRHHARYFPNRRALEELRECCELCTVPLKRGEHLFRSRILPPRESENMPLPTYSPAEMGAPPPPLAVGNRLNPPGIPYLYLAADPETALAEARPWKGSYVSVGRFELLEDLLVYDFSIGPAGFLGRRLSEEFATPSHPSSPHDYAPSQFVAEVFKSVSRGAVAGLRYRSAMRSGGVNVALFGGDARVFPQQVACTAVELWLVQDVSVHAAVVPTPSP